MADIRTPTHDEILAMFDGFSEEDFLTLEDIHNRLEGRVTYLRLDSIMAELCSAKKIDDTTESPAALRVVKGRRTREYRYYKNFLQA